MSGGLPPHELAKVRRWLASQAKYHGENPDERDEGGRFAPTGSGGGGSVPSVGSGPKITSDKYTSPRGVAAAMKAVKSIPESHRDGLKNVSIKVYESTTDFKLPAGQTGMYSPKNKTIEVAESFKLGGRTVPVASVEQTVVRELGRAYNDASAGKAANNLDTSAAVNGMSFLERMRARHFIKNKTETFTELYTLAYGPDKRQNAFGLGRARAEELYAGPLAQLRAMGSPISLKRFDPRSKQDDNRLVQNGVAVNDDGAVYAIINGAAYEVDASDTPLTELAPGDYTDAQIQEMLKRW